METILAATDFSPVTKAVVAQAVALAAGRDSRIVLLHVVNPPGMSGSPNGVFTELVPLLESMRRVGSRKLRHWCDFLQRKSIAVETVQVDGFPSFEILRQAKKLAANYIVIGSHGHSGLYDLLVGSTTGGILRKSKCPILVVPAQRNRSRP